MTQEEFNAIMGIYTGVYILTVALLSLIAGILYGLKHLERLWETDRRSWGSVRHPPAWLEKAADSSINILFLFSIIPPICLLLVIAYAMVLQGIYG